MESTAVISSRIAFPVGPSPICNQTSKRMVSFGYELRFCRTNKISALLPNGSVSSATSLGSDSRSVTNAHNRRSSLESLFCYDKAIPEEIIETPIGVSLLAEKAIGENLRCADCEAKGAVRCTTCSGSGLYVDSVMESQGIIVKVRCLGILWDKDGWLVGQKGAQLAEESANEGRPASPPTDGRGNWRFIVNLFQHI